MKRILTNKISDMALFIICITILSFMGLKIMPLTLTVINYIYIGFPLLILSFFLYKKEYQFGKIIILINFFLLVNSIGCLINRNQSLWSSYTGTEMRNFMMLNAYFIFISSSISVKKLEKCLYYLSIFFCMIYIIQFLVYPTEICYGASSEFMKSNVIRIRLWGQSLAIIAFLMGLNKALEYKNFKYYLQCFLGLIVILLLGFRSQLLVLIATTFILLFRKYKLSFRFFFVLAIVCIFFSYAVLQIPFISNSVSEMIARSEEGQSFANDNYIRTICFDYYTNNFFVNTWESIMGAGNPGTSGNYSIFIDILKNDYGFVYGDWGLIGLSWIVGIPVVLLILLYCMKAFFIKVENKYIYLACYFIFIVFASIFSREIYRYGNFFIQALILAILEKTLIYKK